MINSWIIFKICGSDATRLLSAVNSKTANRSLLLLSLLTIQLLVAHATISTPTISIHNSNCTPTIFHNYVFKRLYSKIKWEGGRMASTNTHNKHEYTICRPNTLCFQTNVVASQKNKNFFQQATHLTNSDYTNRLDGFATCYKTIITTIRLPNNHSNCFEMIFQMKIGI